MAEIELKPCPFCGAKQGVNGVSVNQNTNGFWGALCHSCYGGIWWTYTEEEAIRAWNRRADNEQREAEKGR